MSEPTFDPGRKALARAVSEGLAEVRRKYPGASDEFTSEYLSGWLGHYVVAAQSQARLATIAAIRELVEGLRHEPERGMGQRGWNAALAAIQRIREEASDGR